MDSTCQKDDDLFMTHGTLSAYLRSKFVHPNQMFWIRRCPNKEDNWSSTWDKVGSFLFFLAIWMDLYSSYGAAFSINWIMTLCSAFLAPKTRYKKQASKQQANSQTTNILKQTNIKIDNQAMNLFARLQDKSEVSYISMEPSRHHEQT